jgi:hypothetical protein
MQHYRSINLSCNRVLKPDIIVTSQSIREFRSVTESVISKRDTNRRLYV